MQVLDLSEIKSIEIDEYLDLCLSQRTDTKDYIVYFDSGNTHIEESEVMVQTKNYNEATRVYSNTYNYMK